MTTTKDKMLTNTMTTKNNPIYYEISDLPSLGWVQITHIGEENVYFTLPNGSAGFVKVDS